MPIRITREDVQRMTAEGTVLIDTLPEGEYAEEHIVGAFNVAREEAGHPATIVATQGMQMRNAPPSLRI